MKDKKLAGKNTMLLVALVVLVVAVIGVAYAWLTYTNTSNKVHVIKTGTFELLYNDGEELAINVENDDAVPLSDDQGLALYNGDNDGFDFTLENKGTIAANYTIYLDDTTLTDAPTGGRIADQFIRMQYNTKNDGEENYTTTLKNLSELSQNPEGSSLRILETGILNGSQKKHYNIKLWINNSATSGDINATVDNKTVAKYFAGKIRVEAIQTAAKTGPSDVVTSTDTSSTNS